jgi:environmental stress-induced protein Ves
MALSKMEYWKGLISEWKSSGETREIFCKRKGVTVATFSYWRTKLRKLDSENGNTNPLVRFSIPNLGKPDKIILE